MVSLILECMQDCLQDAHSMVAEGVSLELAAEQAVSIVLDEPYYNGNEVDWEFREAVRVAVLDTLEDFYL